MKRIYTAVFIVILSLLIVSCGAKDDIGSVDNSVENAQDDSIEKNADEPSPSLSDTTAFELKENGSEFWPDGVYQEKNDLKDTEKTITFKGKTYTGIYDYSMRQYFNDYLSDYYSGEECRFSINERDGNIDSIMFFDFSERNDPVKDIKSIADQIVSEYIPVEEYIQSSESRDVFQTYTYEKKIANIKTCERITVGIANSGELIHIYLRSVGEIDKITDKLGQSEAERIVQELTSENAEEKVKETVKNNHPNCCEVEIVDRTVSVINDELCVCYVADANERISMDDGTYGETGERVYVMVKENDQ